MNWCHASSTRSEYIFQIRVRSIWFRTRYLLTSRNSSRPSSALSTTRFLTSFSMRYGASWASASNAVGRASTASSNDRVIVILASCRPARSVAGAATHADLALGRAVLAVRRAVLPGQGLSYGAGLAPTLPQHAD